MVSQYQLRTRASWLVNPNLMKILLCTSFLKQTHNGAGVFARSLLAINAREEDAELRVLTEDPVVDNRVYPLFVNIPAWLSPLGMFLRTFYYHREAKRIWSEYPFDVLFYNSAFTGFWSAMTMPQAIKVYGFVHDYHFALPNRRYKRWSRKGLAFWFYHLVEKLSVRHLEKVFVNSDYLGKLLQHAYALPSKRIQPLYLAVDIDAIPFLADRELDLSQPVEILFVKNDFISGGLEDLIEALALCEEFRFSFTIIGPFKEWERQIEQIASRKGANTEVEFLGAVPHSRVVQEMAEKDILCIPARREAMGLANIEGLASGIPVVTTKVGGIPEILDNGKNGWLCKPEDPKDLARVIKECLTSPEERKQKSNNGRVFVEKNFQLETMITKFLRVLDSTPEAGK